MEEDQKWSLILDYLLCSHSQRTWCPSRRRRDSGYEAQIGRVFIFNWITIPLYVHYSPSFSLFVSVSQVNTTTSKSARRRITDVSRRARLRRRCAFALLNHFYNYIFFIYELLLTIKCIVVKSLCAARVVFMFQTAKFRGRKKEKGEYREKKWAMLCLKVCSIYLEWLKTKSKNCYSTKSAFCSTQTWLLKQKIRHNDSNELDFIACKKRSTYKSSHFASAC